MGELGFNVFLLSLLGFFRFLIVVRISEATVWLLFRLNARGSLRVKNRGVVPGDYLWGRLMRLSIGPIMAIAAVMSAMYVRVACVPNED